jgi:hypothetical protein
MKRHFVAVFLAFTAAATLHPPLVAQSGGTLTQERAAPPEEDQAVRKHLEAMSRALDETARQQKAQTPSQPRERDVQWVFVSTPRPEDRALAEQVMQLDEDFRRAKLAADRSALDRILSEDYIGVNQSGNTRDKKQLLELFEWFRIDSLVTNRANIRFSGDNAIVTGEQTENSATGNDKMLFTRVYTRRASGDWHLLSSTQFRDPRAPGIAGR